MQWGEGQSLTPSQFIKVLLLGFSNTVFTNKIIYSKKVTHGAGCKIVQLQDIKKPNALHQLVQAENLHQSLNEFRQKLLA